MPPSSSAPKNVVEFQLTEREIVNQWLRLRILNPRMAILFALLLGMGGYLVSMNRGNPLGWACIAWPIFLIILNYRKIQRLVSSNPEMTLPRTLTFDDNGVVFIAGQTRNEYAWSSMSRFSETKADYALRLNERGTVAYVPKAAFTEEQREAFLSHARQIGAQPGS